MKICKNCGMQNDDNNLHCINCGAELENNQAPQQYSNQAQPVQQPQPQQQYYAQQPKAPQKQGIPKSTMIVIIVAIIAVAVVAIAGIAILNGSSSDTITTVSSTETTTAQTTESTTAESTTQAPSTTKNQTQPSLKRERPTTTAVPNYYDAFYYDMNNYWLDYEYVTDDYLDTLSKDEVDYLRNAPYAYHGYIFNKDKYWDYFNTISWYSPYEESMSAVEKNFNKVEKKNRDKIVKYQKAHGQL